MVHTDHPTSCSQIQWNPSRHSGRPEAPESSASEGARASPGSARSLAFLALGAVLCFSASVSSFVSPRITRLRTFSDREQAQCMSQTKRLATWVIIGGLLYFQADSPWRVRAPQGWLLGPVAAQKEKGCAAGR